ncbi:class I adenylate-forming enzyme family protein [Lentzea sp. CC55]|uniref:class I adenylate-forming enzyme family protein n=1 Tax=Lentzea sp. CC55 TaxID=2884909 RepID=UPI001F36AC31|nr:class I adenylate-forming enzyme family protein [Lentzea sp. CC55]MCG8927331.1 acyl--CoA ligase [Lentzea sp. CC55]
MSRPITTADTPPSREGAWWGANLLDRQPAQQLWASGWSDVTWEQLRQEVAGLSRELADHGIGVNSTVALRCPPSFTVVWLLLALWSRGSQVVLLDPRLKPQEIERILEHTRAEYTISAETSAESLKPFHDTCQFTVESRASGVRTDDDVCLVLCSSGTTGTPKLIGRTPRHLMADLDRHARNPGMVRTGERAFLLASPVHGFGLACGVLHALNVGATLVFPHSLQPDELVRRARESRVNAILGVPAHFALLSQATGTDPVSVLRLAISCGDVLSAGIRQRFYHRFGVPLGQIYGMSEVGAIASDLTGACQPPAVGRLLPGVEGRCDDGELYIKVDRSPYLRSDRDDRYTDGWLRTFDRCEIDPGSGELRLMGRTDSVVTVGGLKVDLTEVEAVLREHPQVIDALLVHGVAAGQAAPGPVLEAHVTGDASLTADSLVRWCRERLSDFKIPKRIHVGVDLPRNANGKRLRVHPAEDQT